MHSTLLLITAVVGLEIASVIDVLTLQIPDNIPLTMFGIGFLLHLAHLIHEAAPALMVNAFIYGPVFGFIALLLSAFDVWGEGDAILLAVIGFLLPMSYGAPVSYDVPLALTVFFNVVWIGALYGVICKYVLQTQKMPFAPIMLAALISAILFGNLFLGFKVIIPFAW